MYDIKELTKEIHQNAERQEFVKTLMSGTIHPELYAIYLYNQLQCYSVLEKYGMHNDLFRQTPGLQRAEKLDRDFKKLWTKKERPVITDSTKAYCEHIETIMEDPEKLYAHIYVRHLGDLSGGQILKGIAKKALNPREGEGLHFYDFPRIEDAKAFKTEYRSTLDNLDLTREQKAALVEESNYAFKLNMDMFNEMKGSATKSLLILLRNTLFPFMNK